MASIGNQRRCKIFKCTVPCSMGVNADHSLLDVSSKPFGSGTGWLAFKDRVEYIAMRCLWMLVWPVLVAAGPALPRLTDDTTTTLSEDSYLGTFGAQDVQIWLAVNALGLCMCDIT